MLARYYSAGLSRFLSVDPSRKIDKSLENPQRWNRYAYALNNPVKYVDPDGEDVELSPGMQKLVSGGSKEFRQAWSAFNASDAGKRVFGSLDNNPNTKVIVQAASDKSMDVTGDGVGDLYGSTEITKQDPSTGDVQNQEININFENTGGAKELADTFLDEFTHADQNAKTKGTSTEAQDHKVKNEEKKKTNFDKQIDEHIKKIQ